MNWTADALIGFVGAALSLVFGLFPPARRWFETNVSDDYKALFMAICLTVVTIGGLLFSNLAAWPAWSLPVICWPCVWEDIPGAFVVLFAAFGANQGAYQFVIKPKKDAAQVKSYTWDGKNWLEN